MTKSIARQNLVVLAIVGLGLVAFSGPKAISLFQIMISAGSAFAVQFIGFWEVVRALIPFILGIAAIFYIIREFFSQSEQEYGLSATRAFFAIVDSRGLTTTASFIDPAGTLVVQEKKGSFLIVVPLLHAEGSELDSVAFERLSESDYQAALDCLRPIIAAATL